MVYSSDQITEMSESYFECIDQLQVLMLKYVERKYATERGREFAVHGFARRIKTIEHGLRDVFELIPPENAKPEARTLNRANAIIHSVVINVFGSLENLAYLWVHENKILDSKTGSVLSGPKVGLGKRQRALRRSFPSEVRDYIVAMQPWYDYLADYRHALAHRIPPYLVPMTLNKTETEIWKNIDKSKTEKIANHEWDEYERLCREQDEIGTYSPLMMHSYIENAQPIFFHPQIICDALTINEIGLLFLKYLPRR